MNSFDIDGVDIPFDPDWTSIAISLSGGADSALLAYLLCNVPSKLETVHCISHTRMWKTRPWQGWDSLKVYNYLKAEFPNINFVRHTNFISPELEYGNIGPSLVDEYGKNVSGDNIEIRSFAEYVCHWNNVKAYYNAVTRNPRDIDLGGMKERDIELNSSNHHLRLTNHMNGYAIHPFRFIEKNWIIKQYIRFNLIDLLKITRSCEGEFDGINYQTYVPEQSVPECGQCFWCKERNWAFKANGLTLGKLI
jgi:hypothetical protein